MNLRWKIAQRAEIKWWQLYLKNKDKTDYLSWKKQYWKNFLHQIDLSLSVDATILDIGCGPAGVFIHFPNQKVEAIDPLITKYEEKITHFDKRLYPKVQFHDLPFEAFQTHTKFDTIFCINAINHVADLDQCLDKLHHLCKPNSQLILSIDTHNYRFFKHIFRLLPGDILHPHQFDLAEYQQKLSDRNFLIQKTVLLKKEFFFDYYCLVATPI